MTIHLGTEVLDYSTSGNKVTIDNSALGAFISARML